jgi:hypothetical protein
MRPLFSADHKLLLPEGTHIDGWRRKQAGFIGPEVFASVFQNIDLSQLAQLKAPPAADGSEAEIPQQLL